MRIDTWGPKSGDWDQLGRWRVYWLGPFGGWPDVRASATAQAPWTSLDGARRALTSGMGTAGQWMIAGWDDAEHALLVDRHLSASVTADIVVLEADRAPVEVHRPGGEPFPEIEGAARIGGRWYVATMQPAGDLTATVVWLLDGAQAREIARVPRVGFEARTLVRVARRLDGRALGLVVDGQADGERGPAMRWVSSVDLETGAVGDPEVLAPVNLSDRTVTLCTGDDGGWQVDLPYPGRVTLHTPSRGETLVQNPFARVRVSSQRVCFERLAGTVPVPPPDVPWLQPRSPIVRGGATRSDVRTVDVGITSSRVRYSLRCTVK